jgi:hypothetical protein
MTYTTSSLANSTFQVSVPAYPNIKLGLCTVWLQATNANRTGYSVILLQSQKYEEWPLVAVIQGTYSKNLTK